MPCFNWGCWKTLSDTEKEFVQEYHTAVKHGETFNNAKIPKGVTIKVRQAGVVEKAQREKKEINR